MAGRDDMAKATGSPLVRQWLLLKTLSSRGQGMTVRELAEEMEVSEKTIRRDLETFLTAGFPIEEELGDFGRKYYRLASRVQSAELGFTFEEALALYMGRRFLDPLAGTVFWQSAQNAFRKVRASLSSSALKYLEKVAGSLHQTTTGASDYAIKADIVDRLMIGVEDRVIVHITYQSLRATEAVTYDVYPYGITYHRGKLYLTAHSPTHGEVRTFKVDRIEEAETTRLPFTRPKDFNMEAHLAKSFGVFDGGDGEVKVKIRFDREVARYVKESRWRPNQKLTEQKDGALIAEFELSGTEEVKAWILSFGKHAEALKPEELRAGIAAELAQSLKTYGVLSEGKHL